MKDLTSIKGKLYHRGANLFRRIRFPEKYKTLGFLFDYINNNNMQLNQQAKNISNKIITEICTPTSWDFPKNCLCLCKNEEEADYAINRHAAVLLTYKQFKNYPCIIATNPLEAYAKLCRFYRDLQKKVDVTAVIGSIGKTTTKNMIGIIYKKKWNTFYTEENDNTYTYIGFALQHIPPKAEKMIQEVHEGTPNETQYSSMMLYPKIAVITSIDQSHLSRFENSNAIVKEVCSITKNMHKNGIVIVNKDEFDEIELLNGKRVVSISTLSKDADFYAEQINIDNNGLNFKIVIRDNKQSVNVQLKNIYSRHNVICALSAFAAGYCEGMNPNEISEALSQYQTQGERQNIIRTNDNIIIYADCYNAVARSVKSAIEASNIIPTNGKRIAVLGDIEEIGDFSEEMHQIIVEYVNNSSFDVLLTLGEKMKKATSHIVIRDSLYIENFNSIPELSLKIKDIANSGDLILFKASHASHLSKCIKLLWPKTYSQMFTNYTKNYYKYKRTSLLY